MCAPYVAGADGRLEPASGVERCPWAVGGSSCELVHGDWRPRKTGPCFPIEVLRCGVHGRRFTVYPPGYRPYSRRALAPVDPRGELVLEGGGDVDWSSTLFEACEEAASGQIWKKEPLVGESRKPRYATQRRWIGWSARLLGLLLGLRRWSVESVRQALAVNGLHHEQARAAYEQARGSQARAQAVLLVRDQLGADALLLARLLEAGELTSYCGPCRVFDPGLGRTTTPQLQRSARPP